jgi:hypothetical protein
MCRSLARGPDGKPINKRFSPAEIKAKYYGNPKYAGIQNVTLDVSDGHCLDTVLVEHAQAPWDLATMLGWMSAVVALQYSG